MNPVPIINKNKTKKIKRKTPFKSIPISTQIKLENNALITEYNYYTNINQEWLPITDIIKYMKNNYKSFEQELNEIRQNGGEFSLDDIFLIPSELSAPQTVCSFDTNLKQNPNLSFDKFVSIVDWLLSNNRIQIYNDSSSLSDITASIKNQVGKDIFRTSLIEINDEIFYSVNEKIDESIDRENTYKNTDLFNKKIMDVMNNQGIKIDFNTMNIIDILVQQNIGNLLQMNINLFIGKKIAPIFVFDYKFDRNIQIVLNKENQYILQNFKSQLLISNQGELLTTPCGYYSASLKIDLKNKIISLENFILNYDIDSCIREQQTSNNVSNNITTNSVNNSTIQSVNNSVKNIKSKAYNFINNNKATLAAGVATSGLVSVGALYLAGILGGKTNKITRKRNKNNIISFRRLSRNSKKLNIKRKSKKK
jgi:hypothetical protein